MLIDAETLHRFASEVWSGMLGLDCVAAHDLRVVPDGVVTMTGIIQFTGSWEGALMVECPVGLVQAVTGAMFGAEPGAVSDGDMVDALGEVANMIGGSLKAVAGTPVQISLPTVVRGQAYTMSVPGGRLLCRALLECDGSEFAVAVYESGGGTKARAAAEAQKCGAEVPRAEAVR
jgi:chemotaxis protein CheX